MSDSLSDAQAVRIVPARGSDQLARAWFGADRKLTRESLRDLVEQARTGGGEVVAVAAAGGTDPGDWGGGMWLHGPRPRAGGRVEAASRPAFGVETFPRGIVNPDALAVVVRGRPAG